MSLNCFHNVEEAGRGAGIRRVGERVVEGTPPAASALLGGIARTSVEPPTLLTGELPPTGEDCVHVGALAVFHQRPEQDGEFPSNQRAERLIARTKRQRLGTDFFRIHAAQKFLLHGGSKLPLSGERNDGEFVPWVAALGA